MLSSIYIDTILLSANIFTYYKQFQVRHGDRDMKKMT